MTGGAGFIGSEVVRQLVSQNARLTILDNFSSGKWEYIKNFVKLNVIIGDICDNEIVCKALIDQDYVINLAALPFIPDCYHFPQDFFLVNVNGSINLLWQCIESKSIDRFVHISTSEVYGSAKYLPMDEDHPLNPHSTYAVSKLAADRAVFALHKEHSFPAVVVRPFNSFGPNITQPYIIPEIIFQLTNGNGILRLGNVESTRDFTYVEDTARGILLALTRKEAIGQTINIGSGTDVTIRELALLIANLMSRRVRIVTDTTRFRPFDVQRLCSSTEKAEKLLGWKPEVPFETGLNRTIEWVKENGLRFKDPFKGWQSIYRHQNAATEVFEDGILVR